nr:MmcB family DNA repair protein [uncultured Rhodopila sp.]
MEQAHRPDPAAGVGFPERTAFIRRAAARLCLRLGWAPLHEVRLANGRRADILALQPGGGFVCIEVKSGLRDYMADGKWTEYQPFCDQFFFAVDTDFPRGILPSEIGLIVSAGLEAEMLREQLPVRLPAARRKAMLERFAWLAAGRLAALQDPMGVADMALGLNED